MSQHKNLGDSPRKFGTQHSLPCEDWGIHQGSISGMQQEAQMEMAKDQAMDLAEALVMGVGVESELDLDLVKVLDVARNR